MQIKEAILILDPVTSADTIAEIERNIDTNENEVLEKVNDACVIACNIMRDYILKKKDMEWNVYCHEFNSKTIVKWNIFKHRSFKIGVDSLLRTKLQKDDFSKKLKRTVAYYFEAKYEYEILISSWLGIAKDTKVDIYDQVTMNWDKFVDYVWSFRKYE